MKIVAPYKLTKLRGLIEVDLAVLRLRDNLSICEAYCQLLQRELGLYVDFARNNWGATIAWATPLQVEPNGTTIIPVIDVRQIVETFIEEWGRGRAATDAVFDELKLRFEKLGQTSLALSGATGGKGLMTISVRPSDALEALGYLAVDENADVYFSEQEAASLYPADVLTQLQETSSIEYGFRCMDEFLSRFPELLKLIFMLLHMIEYSIERHNECEDRLLAPLRGALENLMAVLKTSYPAKPGRLVQLLARGPERDTLCRRSKAAVCEETERLLEMIATRN